MRDTGNQKDRRLPGVSRRELGLLTGGALAAVAVGASPQAAAQEALDNPRLVLVGPAAVLGKHTVVRVATGHEVTLALQDVGVTESSGVLTNGARMLKVEDGAVEAPVPAPPPVSGSGPRSRRVTESFLVFPPVTGSSVTLHVPGIGVVEGVPVVEASQAPFSLV